jgi:spermidine synthase
LRIFENFNKLPYDPVEVLVQRRRLPKGVLDHARQRGRHNLLPGNIIPVTERDATDASRAIPDMHEKTATTWPAGDWFVDQDSPGDLIAVRREEVLAAGRTPFQEYEIFVSSLWGKALILDGRLQSAELDEFVYHEALVHPALVAHPNPRRVLVMGGGEGATLREVLRHPPVGRAVMVDLDGELVEVCRRHLPSFHGGAFDDPRASVVFADGRVWLADQPEGSFEVIIWDLPEPLEEGPASLLFTREMFAVARRKLSPGGLLAVQSGSGNIHGRLLADIHATLRAVFPRVTAYTAFVTSFMDLYGFHVAGGEDFLWPDASQAEACLAARGVADLRWYAPEFAAGLPGLPRYLAEMLAKRGRVLTDAEPYKPQAGERRSF